MDMNGAYPSCLICGFEDYDTRLKQVDGWTKKDTNGRKQKTGRLPGKVGRPVRAAKK